MVISEHGAENVEHWSPSAAGTIRIMAPIILFMILVQRHIVRGLTFGALKGRIRQETGHLCQLRSHGRDLSTKSASLGSAKEGKVGIMRAQIAFLHTSVTMVEPVRQLVDQLLEIKAFHMVDESLLFDILDAGRVTPSVTRRITRLAISAEEVGVAVAVLTCSSASSAVPAVQANLRIPFLRIDEAMAEEAVSKAKRIGLLATVETTMGPTQALLRQKAEAAGREVELLPELCSGAFRAFLDGDRRAYEELIAKGCRDLASRVDAIVFAQGSMVPIAKRLEEEIPIPIFTPLESGVRHVGEVVRKRGACG